MFPQFHGLLGNRGHVLAKGVQKGHEVQVPCQVLVGVGRMRSPAVLWWNRDVLKSNGFAVLEAKQQPSGLSCARFSCVKTTWACSSLRLRVGIFSSETGSTTQNAPSPKSFMDWLTPEFVLNHWEPACRSRNWRAFKVPLLECDPWFVTSKHSCRALFQLPHPGLIGSGYFH